MIVQYKNKIKKQFQNYQNNRNFEKVVQMATNETNFNRNINLLKKIRHKINGSRNISFVSKNENQTFKNMFKKIQEQTTV